MANLKIKTLFEATLETPLWPNSDVHLVIAQICDACERSLGNEARAHVAIVNEHLCGLEFRVLLIGLAFMSCTWLNTLELQLNR